MRMGYGSSELKLHSLTDFKPIRNTHTSENELLLEKWIARQRQILQNSEA